MGTDGDINTALQQIKDDIVHVVEPSSSNKTSQLQMGKVILTSPEILNLSAYGSCLTLFYRTEFPGQHSPGV